MPSANERQLMRLLHGELPAEQARRLEQELAQDDELRALHERIAEAWSRLDPPASADPEPPAGFAASVVAAARAVRDGELSWSLAPVWARAGGALALAVGLTLGATLGGTFGDDAFSDPFTEEVGLYADSEPLSLAEVYWMSLEEDSSLLFEAGDGATEESVQ